MIFESATDLAYRRLYYYLHKIVDQAIGRILEALQRSGMADDTLVVFTSDHGDLLGAHGGLIQKWFNAFDEATRIPLLVAGPGVSSLDAGISIPTSHVDLIPTLMGLVGIDVEAAAAGVAEHHDETQALPGRDLSAVITGRTTAASQSTPVYFMTEDNPSKGSSQVNVLSGEPFDAVSSPSNIESVVASLPTGTEGGNELWKLNHYYDRLDDWYGQQGFPKNPFQAPPEEPLFEMHNLTQDPEERHNQAESNASVLSLMKSVLADQRDAKRRVPSLRNAVVI